MNNTNENIYICGSCGQNCTVYTYNEVTDVDECNRCKKINKTSPEQKHHYNFIVDYIDIDFNDESDFVELHLECHNGKSATIYIEPINFLNSLSKHQINRVKSILLKQIQDL